MADLHNYFQDARINSQMLHYGNVINLRLDSINWPDGRSACYEVLEHNGGVVIICQPNNDEIVLIKQFRYSIGKVLYELPAGKIDKGEDPLVAAKRELQEETGYSAKNWQELSRMYSAPGFCNELLYLYKACDVTLSEPNPDEHEEIEVMLIKIQDAWQLVLDASIQDAKTIAGLGLVVNQL